MSHESTSERLFSPFWPLLVFLTPFTLSCFYQLYVVIDHRGQVQQRYQAEAAQMSEAKAAEDQLVGLVKDLIAASDKDSNAAQIIREVKQAGILHIQSNNNAAQPNGAAAPSPDATTAAPGAP